MFWKGRGKVKKLIYILSMTSILFITACSTTNIKKPNKGKSVDKISFKYMTPSHITENVEISSSESFDDIYNKLGYPYYEMSYTNKLSRSEEHTSELQSR